MHALRKKDHWKRIVMRFVAPKLLPILHYPVLLKARCRLPHIKYSVSLGDRFGYDASIKKLFSSLGDTSRKSLLVVGCGCGTDESVQLYLRRGFSKAALIDTNKGEEWDKASLKLEQMYKCKIKFLEMSAEDLKFENNSFDMIVSAAVMEHIKDVRRAAKEMKRVLKPDGLVWHSIGPLYHTYGGDHCIAEYGFKHGFDHLLEDKKTYRSLIEDQAYFTVNAVDSRCNHWAINNIFSFLTFEQYMEIFQSYFDIRHLILIVSPEAIRFRKAYSKIWKKLLASGISETSLLVKGINILLKK